MWPENMIKQDEVKENTKRSNSIKREAQITDKGISYDNILSDLADLLSATKITEDSTDSILQATPTPLSSDTLKEAFIHMGVNIDDLTNIKKQTFALDIDSRWGKYMIK